MMDRLNRKWGQYLEAEGGRLGVQGQCQLWIKFQASLVLILPCFKNNKNTDKKNLVASGL